MSNRIVSPFDVERCWLLVVGCWPDNPRVGKPGQQLTTNNQQRSTSLAALICLICCAAMWGQTDTATLSGRVTDASGGVMVGADVTLTNTATGTSNQMKTNQPGASSFSALRPGPYRLAVRAAGFPQAVREGLVLHVQDPINQDVSLAVGSSGQEGAGTREAPLINTTST